MRIRSISIAAALVALSGAWPWMQPSHAMSTEPMNLADLVRGSSQIVVGTVSAVNQGVGPNQMPYTEVRLNVSETILGEPGATLTFRQFGLQSPQPVAEGRKYVGLVAGMPTYAAGDHVVLFLGRTSTIGFRTTIGLGQGRFALRGGTLQNEVNNTALFQNLNIVESRLDTKEKSMVATRQGGVGSDTFLGLVRRAVSEKWWDASRTKHRASDADLLDASPDQTEGGAINE